MTMRAIAIAVLLAAACGGKDPSRPAPTPAAGPTPDARAYRPGAPAERPQPPPIPSDAEFEAMMNQALAMFDAMAKAVDRAGDDCDALADAFNKVLDDHWDYMNAAKAYKDDAAMAKRAQEWMKGKMEVMMPGMMKIGTAAQRCAVNGKFQAVMTRMDELK